jgi:hypothetical protein
MTSEILIQRLRTLVGSRFRYLDITWRLAEVLGQEDALVLVHADGEHAPLQQNQYGHSTRRVPRTLTLPLSDSEQDGYSDEVMALLAGKLPEA